jgi:hypothetical protein
VGDIVKIFSIPVELLRFLETSPTIPVELIDVPLVWILGSRGNSWNLADCDVQWILKARNAGFILPLRQPNLWRVCGSETIWKLKQIMGSWELSSRNGQWILKDNGEIWEPDHGDDTWTDLN